MTNKQRTILILGANGGIGGETADAFYRHGWKVRALARRGAPSNEANKRYEWRQGDVMHQATVMEAAQGVDAILHGVNPPSYRNWANLVLPMMEHTLAAAQASDARILLPGTVYNYGPDAFPLLQEGSPQHARTFKGKIRIALEQKLQDAASLGIRSLILRAGDFFGPRPGGNWFSQGMIKPNKAVKGILYPGKQGIGHAWCYLPDVAETFAQLMDKEDALQNFERFHFRGYQDTDGTQMLHAIRSAVGNASIPVRSLPWWLFRIASPFQETMREIYATRPLWNTTIELDNTKLVRFLGKEPSTPLLEAVRTTLRGLHCIH